jgi:hypothetical protein
VARCVSTNERRLSSRRCDCALELRASAVRGLEPAVPLGVDPVDPPANFPDEVPEGLAAPPLAVADDPGAGCLGFEEVDPDGVAVPDLPVPPPNARPPEGFELEDGAEGLDEPPDGRELPPEEGLEEPPADGRPPPDRAPPLEPPRRWARTAAGAQRTAVMITQQGNHRKSGMRHSSIEKQRRTERDVGPDGTGTGGRTPSCITFQTIQTSAEARVNPPGRTGERPRRRGNGPRLASCCGPLRAGAPTGRDPQRTIPKR